jgi:phage tail-like protein
MTQAIARPSFTATLMPLRLPEADPDFLAIPSQTPMTEGKPLLLLPGEVSEMLVRLENRTDRAIALRLELVGEFPGEWGSLEAEQELPAGRVYETTLRFLVPPNFLEPLLPDGRNTPLDYSGRLQIYRTEASRAVLVESIPFSLYVRPASRYLRLLPQIYREIDFVGRFLSVMEQAFDPDVQILNNLWAYFDPLTAPQSTLPFLAHWVGWHLPTYLNLSQQRYLIRHALEIYRWRGTKRGLRLYLHLATGLPLETHGSESQRAIAITEAFHQGFVVGEAKAGEDAILGGGRPFHFTVHLRSSHLVSQPVLIDESLVRAVIEQEKPAFSTYDLYIA